MFQIKNICFNIVLDIILVSEYFKTPKSAISPLYCKENKLYYAMCIFTRDIQNLTPAKVQDRVSEISLSCTFCRCLILFLTFISSCVLFDSYVLLADDHVNNASYFPFMSIKKVVPYFCVLREGYYVIIWLIVRICMFIKD